MPYTLSQFSDSALGEGRRTRNKNEKLAKITQSARELLASKGFGQVTTAEVAKSAHVASGTLFLYAKNKAELLLLAQNADYATALEVGVSESGNQDEFLGAVKALWSPVFACNRKHIENGRAYLREVMFGDPAEPNRAEALSLMKSTEYQTGKLVQDHLQLSELVAGKIAQNVSASALTVLVNPENTSMSLDELLHVFIDQVALVTRIN